MKKSKSLKLTNSSNAFTGNYNDDDISTSLGRKESSSYTIYSPRPGKAKLHEIPEILEIIFSYFDTSVIKIFRFINKTWNEEACRLLQFKKDVSITARSSFEHENFINLLETNTKLKMPLPFRSITLYIDSNSIRILDKILTTDSKTNMLINLQFYETPSSTVSRITGLNQNPTKLSLFKLLANPKLGYSLKTFEFGSCKEPDPDPYYYYPHLRLLRVPAPVSEIEEIVELTFYFPLLTKIIYLGPIGNTSMAESLIHIINSSPNLRYLNLCPDVEPNYLTQIFTTSHLNSISHLEFDISAGILPSAKSVRNIEKLTVTMTTPAQDVLLQRELIHEFADVLQQLDIIWNPKEWNLIENENGFPHCPNLRKLSIHDWGTNIGFFTPEKLPQLKEITFFQDILSTDSNAILLPHPGVEIIRFNKGILYPNNLIPQAQFHRFLRHLSVQFPNIIGLYLTWNISTEAVHIIINKFKNLEILEMNSRCGFKENILTGFGINQIPHHLPPDIHLSDNDNPDETANAQPQRKPCLVDLKKLKHLSLQHATKLPDDANDVTPLTYNGVKFGVAKIPRLKTLRVNWTSDLPIALLKEDLQHVDSIELIIDDQNIRQHKEFCLLTHMWPHVKLIRINLQEPNTSWVTRLMTWMKTFVGIF